MTKLKVGIAGYGIVGKRRNKFIDLHPDLVTVAVCDQSIEKEGMIDGADGKPLHAYRDYKSLLNHEKETGRLDALFVCLPNYLASEVTCEGLKRGLHVFCEKPPGRDVADIEKVRTVEKQNPKLKLMYGFNHRYHDSVVEALRMVRSGELGKLINIRGVYGKSKMINFDRDWRTERKLSGGGILLDQGIHMLDMMRLFAGEFDQVHSFISNDHWKHDVEDNAYALLKSSKTGVVAMMHSSATQWRHNFRLELHLSQGALILSGILSSTKSYGAERLTVVQAAPTDMGDPKEVTTQYNKDHSWEDEIAAFARSVTQNTAIESGSSLDALETMRLVYQIYCADPDWKSRYSLRV